MTVIAFIMGTFVKIILVYAYTIWYMLIFSTHIFCFVPEQNSRKTMKTQYVFAIAADMTITSEGETLSHLNTLLKTLISTSDE